MPFRECSIVSQREEFCRLALSPPANIRSLCRRFGIVPATGYEWIRRYQLAGPAGLSDRSRRPHASPAQTTPEREARILSVRAQHPAWGGRKIRKVLETEGLMPLPAASTITAVLRRHGRLDGPGAGQARALGRFEHAAPNDLWQMDFKGHFATGQGRCHPLTVLDDHSRYALALEACADEQARTVQERLALVFGRYGLPWRLLTDNGPPWGTAGGGTHTGLTVWLMDLGVRVVHGRPYHPQTQGKDERFHRTLKAEVLDGRSFASLAEAQAAFARWREIYNSKRPHEGIGLATPASRYTMSARAMPVQIAPPEYEPGVEVRVVRDTGWIRFEGRQINCSKAFAGRRVALRATPTDGVLDLCYRSHVLAQVDLHQNSVQPVHHVSEHPFTLSPV